MSRLPHQSRTTAKLSDSLDQRLNLYSLGVSTVGISILTWAQPAQARIVYTPANVKITQNQGLITFDLNHDGIPDFGLSNQYVSTSQGFTFLKVKQHQEDNQIWQVSSQGKVCAGALPAGTKVGPNGNFKRDPKSGLAMAFANFEGTTYGPWNKVKKGYLGLKFVIKGKTHFGWARIKLTSTGRLSTNATLTGYAYETIPGKSIIAGKTKGTGNDRVESSNASLTRPAPEPATLATLAVGAPALAIWRREELTGAR
jgi:hypothetical protein